MMARMRSGRSGWGEAPSSSCSVMRSSYASSVVPDGVPSCAAAACNPGPCCCRRSELNSASSSSGSCPHSCHGTPAVRPL